MISTNRGRKWPARRRRESKRATIVTAILMLAVTGCRDTLDSILEVDRPGQLPVAALEDPDLVAPLFEGTQAFFECAFRVYVSYFGKWSGVIANANARDYQVELRNFAATTIYDRSCEGGSYTNSSYASLHTARSQGELTETLASKFTDEEVEDRLAIIGKSQLYQGYAVLLLSEAYCAVTIDAGPVLGRAEGFQVAADHFTDAIATAGQVPGAADATLIRNAALLGRARAQLNLGQVLGVVADVDQVAAGFVFYSTHELSPSERTNLIFEVVSNPGSNSADISEFYRPLRLLEGVPDPRVPVILTAQLSSVTNFPVWSATRYSSAADDMPVATWREGQIMKAEMLRGQAAVDIINNLRATVDEAPFVPAGTYNLPVFNGGTTAEIFAQIKDERSRETFLMGAHMGDLLRWGDPFPQGIPERGGQYNDANTCRPFPDYEVVGNPNITADPPWPVTPM